MASLGTLVREQTGNQRRCPFQAMQFRQSLGGEKEAIRFEYKEPERIDCVTQKRQEKDCDENLQNENRRNTNAETVTESGGTEKLVVPDAEVKFCRGIGEKTVRNCFVWRKRT